MKSVINYINLLNFMKRTIIIISHNITNLKFCDKIYELKNRKISQI